MKRTVQRRRAGRRGKREISGREQNCEKYATDAVAAFEAVFLLGESGGRGKGETTSLHPTSVIRHAADHDDEDDDIAFPHLLRF